MMFLATAGGQMDPIVNFSGFWCNAQHTHPDAVALAAHCVAYMNRTHSAATKVWEVGNEVYGSWEQGCTDGTTYGREFADYYTAMKALDSTIEIGAIASPAASDYSKWTSKVLTASTGNGGVVADLLVIQAYPYSPTTTRASADAAVLANVSRVAQWTSSLDQVVSRTLGQSYAGKIGYRLTECGGSLSPTKVMIEYVEAMFDAQIMMGTALHGSEGLNKWAARNGTDATLGGDWGFLDGNNNPRPD